MHSIAGTLLWMAPEVFRQDETPSYDMRADIYSFGILLWELWTREVPFNTTDAKPQACSEHQYCPCFLI